MASFSASSKSYILKQRALGFHRMWLSLSGGSIHPGLGFLFREGKTTERPLEYGEEVAAASGESCFVLFLFKKRPRMKEVGEGGGGWPVHRLRMKTALCSGLLHLGPQSAGAAQGATGAEETAGLGWGPIGVSSQRHRTPGGRPRDARARAPQRALPVGRGRIRRSAGTGLPHPAHRPTRTRAHALTEPAEEPKGSKK